MIEVSIVDLPPGWTIRKLGDVFATSSGGTPSRKNADFFRGTIPWVKSGELNDGIIRSAEESISIDALDSSSAKLLREGTLLIALYGATVGKLGILSIRAATNQAVCAINVPQPMDVRYLFWYLAGYRSELLNARKGGAQPNISQQIVRDISLPLAPENEQRRIVAKLEELFTQLDAGVAGLRQVQAKLKRYRVSVLKAAVEGRLVPTEAELARAEGRAYEPADDLLARILTERRANAGKKFKETVAPDTANLPELPEGWVWGTVMQVGEVQLGRQRAPKYHNGDNMRPYLRVANVYEDRIDTSDVMEMNFSPSEYKIFKLEYGDILLNEGQSLEWVGRPAMFRNEVPGACFQNTLVRFRSYASVESRYALLVFRAYLHSQRFQKIARWTVNIAHLGTERFANLEFPLPPIAEQHRIVAEVERRLSVIEELEAVIAANLKRADRLRQSILKQAFQGKLVPQDPHDEPAAVLLERIRAERVTQRVVKTPHARENR